MDFQFKFLSLVTSTLIFLSVALIDVECQGMTEFHVLL